MANIALISCNLNWEPYPVYPLGMGMVAAAARARKHDVLQLDVLMYSESTAQLFQTLRSFQPDVVGLSLRNIDNVDSCNLIDFTASYVHMARTVRKYSSCPIVLGGSGYSLFPDILLSLLEADYGIVGEGEAAFCNLVDQLMSGVIPIQRIICSHNELAGAEFTASAYDSRLVSFYIAHGGILNMQTKRGCPYNCAYCTYPLLEGRKYRVRSPEAVVDDIEMLVGEYSVDYYAIIDSVFNDRDGHYLSIAEGLIRRGIRVPWIGYFHPASFRRNEVDLLKRAGLHSVEWGTDCSSDTTLEQMRKGFTWADVEHSNRLFADAGICNAHFIIFGGPGETELTLREGLANIERLHDCVVIAFCGVRILPNTHIHHRAIKEGVVTAEQDLLKAEFYFSPLITEPCLYETLRNSFNDRPDRIWPPSRDIAKVQALHSLGHRGPAWNYLLRKRNGEDVVNNATHGIKEYPR